VGEVLFHLKVESSVKKAWKKGRLVGLEEKRRLIPGADVLGFGKVKCMSSIPERKVEGLRDYVLGGKGVTKDGGQAGVHSTLTLPALKLYKKEVRADSRVAGMWDERRLYQEGTKRGRGREKKRGHVAELLNVSRKIFNGSWGRAGKRERVM